MTQEEQFLISNRIGNDIFEKRVFIESNRELKFGDRFRWCPLAFICPVVTFALKITGLWKYGYRGFHDIQVRENSVVIPHLPNEFENFRILHLSDLHFDLETSLTQVVINKIKDLSYDIVVITGDFNNYTIHKTDKAFVETEKLMPFFKGRVYAVLGNHDSLDDVPVLEKMGMTVLLNEHVKIERGTQSIYLAGIDDPNIFKTHDLKKATRTIPEAAVKLLLSHSPCIYKEAGRAKIDFVMAGHTHGGQVCLPFGIMAHPRNYRGSRTVWRGAWKDTNVQGWTSAGTGASGVPIRINCPPEIVIHKIQKSLVSSR